MKISMMISATALLAVVIDVTAQESKVKMADLPPAVRQAISEHSKGGIVRGVSTEMEDGKRVYEAELRINGKTKDITFDAEGAVVSAEEETSIDRIPSAARAAIEKAAVGGKIGVVEVVTEHGATFYEAHVTASGRKSEIKVDAAGQPVK